jgi:hypothetical protein
MWFSVLFILRVQGPGGYGMVWYGAPPTPWTAIVATRWWQLDRAPAEHAQTESGGCRVSNILVSVSHAPGVATPTRKLCMERSEAVQPRSHFNSSDSSVMVKGPP